MFGSLSLTVVVSWLLLLSSCFALKLHFNEHPQTSEQVLYLDNLNATGANWYYGTTNASAYEIKIYGQGLLGKPKPC